MAHSRYGNVAEPTSHVVYCAVHRSIQIKRRKRNGEWLQLMKECPLCAADDDDSDWDPPSGGRRTDRSPRQQQTKKRIRRATTSSSQFKERKLDEPSDPSDPARVDSAALCGNEEEHWAETAPGLPFSSGCASNGRARRSPSDAQLIKYRKERLARLKEMKQRRRPNSGVDARGGDANDSSSASENPNVWNDSYISEARHHNGRVMTESAGAPLRLRNQLVVIEEVTMPPTRRKDYHADTSDVGLDASLHSEANLSEARHHNGRVMTESAGAPLRLKDGLIVIEEATTPPTRRKDHRADASGVGHDASLRSDSNLSEVSHHNGTVTSARPLFGKHVMPRHSFHSAKTRRRSNESKSIEPATPVLEVSYDSFCTGGGLHRVDSDDRTEVTNNTSSEKLRSPIGHDGAEATPVESIEESAMDVEIVSDDSVELIADDSDQDLNRATLDIWGGGNSRCDYDRGGRKGAVSRQRHPATRSIPKARLPVNPEEELLDNMTRQLLSMNISVKRDDICEGLSRQGTEEALVEGTASEGPHRGDVRANRRSKADCGLDPPGLALSHSLTPLKRPGRPSNAPRPPHTTDPSERSPNSGEELVDEALGYFSASTPSPRRRERKKARVHGGRETDHPSPSTRSLESRSSSSTNLSSRSSRSSSRHASAHSYTTKTSDNPLNRKEEELVKEALEYYERKLPSVQEGQETDRPSDPSTRCRGSRSLSSASSSNPSSHSLSRTGPGSHASLPSSESDVQRGTSLQTNPAHDSSTDHEKQFNLCDSKGRCICHPHIQLRKKKRVGGWKSGRWKTVTVKCTECCFEEVQRLRAMNLNNQKKQPSPFQKAAKTPTSFCTTSSGDDTSTTGSMSAFSSQSSDSSVPKYPEGIARKHNSSVSPSNSTQSSVTTTFSYPSSSSTGSSSTSVVPRPAGPVGPRPRGILKNAPAGPARGGGDGRLSTGPSENISRSDSGRSDCGKVVFAGRDHIINPSVRCVR